MKYRDNSRLDLANQARALWHKVMNESYTAKEVCKMLRISRKRLACLRQNHFLLFDKRNDDRGLRYPKFQFERKIRPYLWRVLYYLGRNTLDGYLDTLHYRKADAVGTSYMDLILAGKGERAIAQARSVREYNRK